MEQDHLNEIIRANPNIDESAITRSRQAMKKLAEAGIKLGGYRLTPALSDVDLSHSDDTAGQDLSRAQRVHGE